MSVRVSCLSFRQPYAGLVLDGVKTVESRWRPVLPAVEERTLAVHIAQRDWEGEDWREVLSGALHMDPFQIRTLLESGERYGRGVVAGLVEVGETWCCSASLPDEDLRDLERRALLVGLQDKFLTRLSNPRWLTTPLFTKGHKDIWTVDIPISFLPPDTYVHTYPGLGPAPGTGQ
ncbi:protein EOLA1 [Lampris incognitus]|uniref:protein EOLA1 n=1 Tax=Lampris incognitus TaxID=2546036 RepID=UPI0024B5EA2F|nr:protein EOLA1 [Lampris incognitus]